MLEGKNNALMSMCPTLTLFLANYYTSPTDGRPVGRIHFDKFLAEITRAHAETPSGKHHTDAVQFHVTKLFEELAYCLLRVHESREFIEHISGQAISTEQEARGFLLRIKFQIDTAIAMPLETPTPPFRQETQR